MDPYGRPFYTPDNSSIPTTHNPGISADFVANTNRGRRSRNADRERAIEHRARERRRDALLELTTTLENLPQDVSRQLIQQLDASILYINHKNLPQWLLLSLATATIQ